MWRSIQVIRSLFLFSLIIIISNPSLPARAQGSLDRWEEFDFSSRSVELKQLKDLGLEDLKFLRGIVFGRHGRIFKDPYIQTYLKGRRWYKPSPTFENSMLNATERRNLDVIREAESAQHEFIQPGDLRFYRDRLFRNDKLGEHTGAEWLVLRSEVEAIHGKQFEDPWLKRYFEERYWYTPNPQYDSKQLNPIEQENLRTIIAAQKKQRSVAVSPGDMELFQDIPLTETMLKGVNLHELRLMRNEFFARHGRAFTALWLQQYFDFQPWYKRAEETDPPTELSLIETENVNTIVRVEKRLREELSAKTISPQILQGLFVEDARK